MAFLVNLRTAVVEGIHLTDPRTAKWRFMFLKAYLSVQKESVPARIISTNILNHVTREESHIAQNVRTSLRLWSRITRF